MGSSSGTSQNGPRVVLDAGHGGSDPGAISPYDGTREKDVCWRTATAIRDHLRGLGTVCDVVPHRPRGRTPLSERVKSARRKGADYVVSLHCNAGGGRGYEVFYPLRESYTEASRQFAHRLGALYGRHTGLKARSPYDGVKSERQARVRRLGVLHGHTKATMAVLLEMLFIGSRNELRLAKSGAFAKQVCRVFEEAILMGIER